MALFSLEASVGWWCGVQCAVWDKSRYLSDSMGSGFGEKFKLDREKGSRNVSPMISD